MKPLILSIVFIVACSSLSVAQCFLPLSNGASNSPSDWADMVTRKPIVNDPAVKSVLTIDSGRGDKINLDFYSVTFRKDSTKALATVFREIRQHFSSFAHRGATTSEDAMETYFKPYQASAAPDDAVRQRNKALWDSNDPRGAVMSFTLATYTPALALKNTLRGFRIVLEQGDVVATCATDTDFVFSTVNTINGGYHPVSGNRGFGIKDNGNGTWTFYSKGADRETRVSSLLKGFDSYFGNTQLKRGARNPPIEGSMTSPNDDAVFQAGDLFWREFFPNLMEYLDQQGMKVEASSFIRNSNRYSYPLPPPPPIAYFVPGMVPPIAQTKDMDCWAVSTAILVSWHEKRFVPTRELVARLSSDLQVIYNTDVGLFPEDEIPLESQVHLRHEPPQNYSVDGWLRLLKEFGPLWVAEAFPLGHKKWGVHERIVYGISGDGTADGTILEIIDPDGGRVYGKTINQFKKEMEEVAKADQDFDLRPLVHHF
ncbi:MAG TPA: papain-like cysteine protease family protein [Pyrinomonadaceae bacterium]|nr:papain-like cysteine protease family protein [Pyrinomonadaceae bacterium]